MISEKALAPVSRAEQENTKSANDMGQLISPNATTDDNGTVTQAGTGESRLLLNLIVQLTNSQAGKAIPVGALWMNDAQVLALKFYYHLASLHVLVQPVEVAMPQGTTSHIDHGSVLVLARAALETFLTFAHVFGCSEYDLREFRHMTWRCAGLLDRQKLRASARRPENKQRLVDERASIETLRAEMQAHGRWVQHSEKEHGAFLKTVTQDAAATAQRCAQRRSTIQQSIAAANATLARRDAILGAATLRDEAQLRIGRDEALVAPLQATISALGEKQLALTSLNSSLQGLESQGATKATLFTTLQTQASVINTVPCAGHEMHNTCPLLSQAREASGQVAELRVSLESLRTSFRAKRQEAEELAPKVAELATRRAELKALTEALTASRREFERATELASQKPLLDAATAALEAAQRDQQLISGEETASRTRCEEQTVLLTAQQREVESEVSRLAAVDVTAAITAVGLQLSASREAIAAHDGRIEALIRSQATREAERDAIAKELASESATQSRANRISDEIASWKLLAKGLGNEGVVALTIDDAGPALTQTVNDLLLACYGPRFTGEIRTQRELASGEVREGFEILVHDADRDSTKAVGVMSGGQKVWINECLTRGIALYLARNAGQPYRTLFSDESDGPLDPERKLQFMRMKREVLRQGGYEREFFISQTPDLIDEADAIIDVAALAV